MKPTIFELTLNLEHPSFAGRENQTVARALRLAADRVEAEGICPGGVWGGIIADRVGHWVVRVVPTDSED